MANIAKKAIYALYRRHKSPIYIYSFLHFIITDKTCQQILSPKSLITPLPFGEGLGVRLFLLLARHPRLELLEEVVALVVNEDESREVFNCNLPDSLHAKLRIFYTLDALDRTL